jgi:polyhydroxybutyrate depolymerase
MTALMTALLALVAAEPETIGPGNHLRYLEVDRQKRSYWVHVPPSYDSTKATPVVLALHGATMSAKGMEALTGLSKKADQAGFIVVYPNGAGSPFLQTWNCGGFNQLISQSRPNDVKFIAKLLDELEENLTIDKNRVYATGLSNGAMMCYRLAAELSERIAAIAPVSGTIALEEYEPAQAVPVLHIHGTVDNLVPFEGAGATVANFLRFRSVEDSIAACVRCNGCATCPKIAELPTTKDRFKVTRSVYEAGKDGAEVVLYVVEGGGHTWPGRPFGGGILGACTMNLDANDVIWDFFCRHPHK